VTAWTWPTVIVGSFVCANASLAQQAAKSAKMEICVQPRIWLSPEIW
jgi:hypothetical protein